MKTLTVFLTICLIGSIFLILQPDRSEPKATILRISHPNYSCCARCGVPWKYVQEHDIRVNKHLSVFYMCEACWDESTLGQRATYCRKAWLKYHKDRIDWDIILNEIERQSTGFLINGNLDTVLSDTGKHTVVSNHFIGTSIEVSVVSEVYDTIILRYQSQISHANGHSYITDTLGRKWRVISAWADTVIGYREIRDEGSLYSGNDK